MEYLPDFVLGKVKIFEVVAGDQSVKFRIPTSLISPNLEPGNVLYLPGNKIVGKSLEDFVTSSVIQILNHESLELGRMENLITPLETFWLIHQINPDCATLSVPGIETWPSYYHEEDHGKELMDYAMKHDRGAIFMYLRNLFVNKYHNWHDLDVALLESYRRVHGAQLFETFLIETQIERLARLEPSCVTPEKIRETAENCDLCQKGREFLNSVRDKYLPVIDKMCRLLQVLSENLYGYRRSNRIVVITSPAVDDSDKPFVHKIGYVTNQIKDCVVDGEKIYCCRMTLGLRLPAVYLNYSEVKAYEVTQNATPVE